MTSMHYLESADGQLLAQALTKAKLPKIAGAKHVEVKLEPYQISMLADGLPAFLLMTASQRAAAWRANPPRAFKDTMSEARKKEEELAKLREAMPQEPVMGQPKKKAKPAPIDVTGKRWNTSRSKWEPDPFYDPTKEKKAQGKKVASPAKPTAKPVAVGSILEQFGVKEGSFREALLKALVKFKDKIATPEELAQATYKDKTKVGPMLMVMKGLQKTIDDKNLPWTIDKSDKGFQLYEA